MASKLRKSFIKLLDEDREFRYTVAGYLGLAEILKRLDAIEEEIRKLWEEVKTLRESQEKLWLEVKNLREGQEKLWENSERLWAEVKSLREGQEKLWEEVRSLREGQEKLWEEVRSLREGQNKLWEGQEKLWEEVRSLREGQNKLWENSERLWAEVKSLREGQEKLWEGQNKLWEEYRRLRKYMHKGFTELGEALGVTFEMSARAFVAVMLAEMGYEDAIVVRKSFLHNSEIVEIDIFCDEPLVVGEVTSYVKDFRTAELELSKLLERRGVVERIYGRKPLLTLLVVGNAAEEVSHRLVMEAEKAGVRLVLGREIGEIA